MERQTITGSLSTSGRLSGALSVGGSTTDYNMLGNKPKINNVELVGNKNSADLGLEPAINYPDDQTKYYNGRGQWTTPPSGVTSYNDLTDKPSINGVTLSGNKTADDLELSSKGQFNSLSGVIVSFNDGQDLPLAKCIADITPVQDLHGYDKPWSGGAGKNKFNADEGSGTESGVTYTNTNGVINAQGTPTADIFMRVGYITPENGVNYILNGCPEGGSNSTYRITLGGYGYDYGNGYSFTGDGQRHAVYCDIKLGMTNVDLTFKPMIRLSTEPSGFEPYSNICPISGHSSVTINVSPTSDTSDGVDTTIQLGQTVYGGWLNVLTGDLTIDRYMVVLDGVNNTVTVSAATNPNGRAVICSAQVNTVDVYREKSLCDKLTWSDSSHGNLSLSEYTATVASGGTSMTVRMVLPISQTATTTEANAYLASNNYTFVFPLATPQTVQLTPQEVNSLLGQNNISADTGDISITYINNVNDPIIKYILNNM